MQKFHLGCLTKFWINLCTSPCSSEKWNVGNGCFVFVNFMAKFKLKDPKKYYKAKKLYSGTILRKIVKCHMILIEMIHTITTFHLQLLQIVQIIVTESSKYVSVLFFLSFEILFTKLYSSFHSLLLRILMKNSWLMAISAFPS